MELADGSGAVLTGRAARGDRGPRFADLAERAAHEIGGLRLAELTVEGPRSWTAPVDVQILVGTGEATGGRSACTLVRPLPDPGPGTPPVLFEPVGGHADRRSTRRRTSATCSTWSGAPGAAVLGHADVEAVPPDRGSWTASSTRSSSVELRNRLDRITGLRLPSTVVFDHPRRAGARPRTCGDGCSPRMPEAAPEDEPRP